MLSHENNPPVPVKSIGKSTVQHNSSDKNATGDKDLSEVEHQLISSSVDAHDFSIRDFVLAARSKDIGMNWPFSDKHLKLCLKHGVKDLLPPFQSKTSKRKQSTSFSKETSVVNDWIITRIPEEPSTKVDSLAVCSLGDVALTQKIVVAHLDVNFDISDKDSEFPSSVTSDSQSYPSRLGGTFKPHKFAKTSAKLSAKKCKLIVKFGSPTVHSSIEGIMPQKTNLSDSPASKVCPVCKTFSSSSNTTLNAHIDQCLSIEATSEGMADSKIGTKCKVKPRKMRSMVDIYVTALECTIEDLDRRNGSSWATDLSTPNRSNGVSSGHGSKKQMSSPPEPDKEDNDDGGVYIDANGRKLRILSKMDSFTSVVTTKDDNGSRKPQICKKSNLGPMHNNKLAVSNKNFLAPKANSSKVLRRHKSTNDVLLSKDESHFQNRDEPDLSRAKGFYQYTGQKLHAVQQTAFKSQKSRMGCFTVETSSSQDFSRGSTCLIEKRKKKRSSVDIHVRATKRIRSLVSNYEKNYNKDTNGHKRLRKSDECVNESNRVGKNSSCKHLKKLSRSEKEIEENRLRTAKSAEVAKHINQLTQKSTVLHRNSSSSLSRLPVHEPQFWKKTLCLTNEEDRVQIEVEEEDEFDDDAYSDEDVTRRCSEGQLMHDTAPESKIDESEEDRRGMSISSKEGALNMSAGTCDDFVDNLGVPLSSGRVVEQERSEIRFDPCMNLTAERMMGGFIRSMNPGVQSQEKADSYGYQSTSSQPSNDSSTGPSSAPHLPNPAFNDGICSYTIMDLESDAAQRNRCDIDPIPIPGPPGSFLPSPGKAETVDYHGNSSLTASVKSSHEQRDGNSYDSLNSAASSISNLAAGTSEKVAANLAYMGIPDSSLLGFCVPDSEVSMDNASKFPQSMRAGVSRNEYGQQKRFLEPQEDNQLCCCSRKERVSRGSVIDQESQLLRRRIMSASILPTMGNNSCSLNTAPSYSCAGSDINSLSSSLCTQVEAIPILGTLVRFSSPTHPDLTNTGKCHNNGDSESASPSAVLRLMGKNLMVAKNDEDLSGPQGDAAPRKAATPRNLPSSGYYSQYQRTAPPDPAMISPSNSNVRHILDFRMSNGPWGQNNFPRPDLTNYSQAMLASLDHKWQQCIPSDQLHTGTSTSTDFTKHESEVGVMKNNVTISKGTGVSVVAEHDQSRLIYPTYPGFQSALYSTPIYMQQGSTNTCFPVPFSGHSATRPQMTYSHNGSYALQGGPFTNSSPSTHPKPGLFNSPRLP